MFNPPKHNSFLLESKNCNFSLDLAQSGKSIEAAQDREPVERLDQSY